MKEFLERLGILLHLLGYISSIVNLIVASVLGEVFFVLISPSSLAIGWALRWLVTGQLFNIIPFFDLHKQAALSVLHVPKIIKSIKNPIEYFYSVLGFLLVGIFIINLDQLPEDREKWEKRVFGETCTNYDGSPKRLGTFSGSNRNIYCRDYPELCTWGENSG